MGVKGFSKAFAAACTVAIKDLTGQTIGIDAMTELYRSALGAKNVKALTDKHGKPTIHINVIFANIIKMQEHNIKQLWVFDHDKDSTDNAEFHNPAKLAELAKRNKKKEAAKKKLELLKVLDDKEDSLFSDTDEEEDADSNKAKITQQKQSLEKQIFSATSDMINDVKLILNCLNIRYTEAPAGYEGEQVAAILSAHDRIDGVYSGDTDPIPFGAKVLYRKNPRDKKIYKYDQYDILAQIADNSGIASPTLSDMRKACVILGTDFADKTKGIGPKTVLKKLTNTELTNDQKKAIICFEKTLDIDTVKITNTDKTPFTDCPVKELIEWLVTDRSFSRKKVNDWLNKVINIEENKPAAKKQKPLPKKKAVSKKRTPAKRKTATSSVPVEEESANTIFDDTPVEEKLPTLPVVAPRRKRIPTKRKPRLSK